MQLKYRKFAFATSIIGFVAILVQMFSSIGHSFEKGRSLALALNIYFSYFTVICNLLVSVGLLTLSIWPDSPLGKWYRRPAVSAAFCLYILIVGIIFYALLVNTWKPEGPEFFATHAMHFYIPLAYFFIWFSSLRESNLRYQTVFKWLIFPACYFGYLMIRGMIINLYPYFFVDVSKYGFLGVLQFALGILVFFTLIGSLLIFVDQRFVHKSNR